MKKRKLYFCNSGGKIHNFRMFDSSLCIESFILVEEVKGSFN